MSVRKGPGAIALTRMPAGPKSVANVFTNMSVAALEVQGASATSICLRHLIPNIAPLIVAQATILFGYAMVDLAAISFLGLGVQAPTANWGVMISENQVGIVQGYPLPALAAAACIVTVVIAVNVLGERLFDQARAGRG